jgi:UDP-glucose 4-epimerase
MSEQILKDYARAYGIDSICFRYFNAAGAMPVTHDLGQETGATHIVARVLEANLRGEPFTVNGTDFDTPDGTCIRDYVHVWDIAQAHIRAVELVSSPGLHNYFNKLTFNLGTGQGISNQEIVDYVDSKYGLLDIAYGPKREGDPATLVADATEANDVLGWRPEHSTLAEIVDSAYQWYCRV